MKRTRRGLRFMAWLLVFVLLGGSVMSPVGASAAKKAKPKLNKKKAVIQVGKTVKLKVKKKPKGKKVKWSSSKKKVATVNKNGLVKGKKKGTAKITAKVGKKKLTCKVTVKAKKVVVPVETLVPTNNPNPGETVKPTEAPGAVPTSSVGPAASTEPSLTPAPTPTVSASAQDNPSSSPAGQTTKPEETPKTEETPKPEDTPEPTATVQTLSTPKSDYIVEQPEIPATPPPEPTPEVTPVYQVTIQVQKDGAAWTDSEKAFYLKKTGEETYTDQLLVENGTYRVYERDSAKDIDTGIDVSVTGQDASVTVEYFTVTFMKDGTNQMNVPAETVVLKGQTVDEPARYEFNQGFTLKQWVTSAGGSTAFNFQSAILAKTEIYADWEAVASNSTQTSYSIKYFLEDMMGNYQEAGNLREENIEGDTTKGVEAPVSIEGYTVDTGRSTPANTTPAADGTTVVSYYYNRSAYTVTWNAGAGKFTDGTTQKTATVKYGFPVNAPGFREGYTCNGWNPPLPSAMPAANAVYTAGCVPTEYTISYGLKSNEQVENYTYESFPTDQWPLIRYKYTVEDESFTLPTPSKVGYSFVGWKGSNGASPQKTVTIQKGSTGNKSYQPEWKANDDTVYYVEHYLENLQTGTYTLVDRVEKRGTTSAQVTEPVRNYEGFCAPAAQTDVIRVNVTYFKYYYARGVYRLTWDAAGGRIDGASFKTEYKSYEEGITAPTVTREGYVFAGWRPAPPNKMPAGDQEYEAQWETAEYTVILSLKLDNYTWAAADAAAEKKTFALYKDSVKAGDFQIAGGAYRIKVKEVGTYQLYEGDKATKISITVNNQSVAQELCYWTVDYYNKDQKSEKLGQQYVLDGEMPVKPVLFRTGYSVKWYGSNNQLYFFNKAVTAPVSLYAKFEPEIYYLKFDLGTKTDGSYEQEVGNLSGVTYDEDDEICYYKYGADAITLPRPKRANYTFVGWTGANGSTPQLDVNIRNAEILKKGIADEDDCIWFHYTANWRSNITCSEAYIDPKKDILSVNNKKKAALNMPLNQLADSAWAGDQVREGVTPHGYSSYIYYDSGYRNFYIVYLCENRVVGMAAMADSFSYQYTENATISCGDNKPSGFKSMSTAYNYSGGYYYDAGDAYVMVFTDQVAGKRDRVYAVQVFAKSVTRNGSTKQLTLDELIKVEKMPAEYRTGEVSRSQADELTDWANAYRVLSGKNQFGTWAVNSQSSAQRACDLLSGNSKPAAGSSSDLMSKYEDMYGVMTPSWIMEISGSRNPDAFGFFVWWLDSQDTNAALYQALTKTPEINEYYTCAGYAYKDNMSYAVMHFVHP